MHQFPHHVGIHSHEEATPPSSSGLDTVHKRSRNDGDLPGPKRRRTALACNRCRSRKVKCDGCFPSCLHCQDGGFTCEYRTSHSHSELQEATPDNTRALEQRLKTLEETVRRLRHPATPLEEEIEDEESPRLFIKELPESCSKLDNEPRFVDDQGTSESSEEDFYGPSSNIYYLRQILKAIDSATLCSFRGADYKFLAFIQPESSAPAAVFHVEPVPRMTKASRNELYALPPVQATIYLVSLFFRSYGSMNPFLDEATFVSTHVDLLYEGVLPPDPSTLALVHMVLAIATASSMESIQPPMRRLVISRLFFERSKGLLSRHSLERGNLKQVQAYLLMAQYLQSTDRCSDAWSTHAMAVQKALRQGLHCENYLHDGFNEELEAKRRTWQLCLFMDSAFSMHFGRPCLLGPYKRHTTLFPSRSIPNPSLNSASRKTGAAEESKDFFYHSFKLYTILGQIVSSDYFQSCTPPPLSQFMDVIASTVCLSRDLDNWLESLPQMWQNAVLCSQTVPKDDSSFKSDLGMVLRLRYHNVRLILHRPVIVLALSAAGRSSKSDDITPVTSSQIATYSRPSIDASMESAEAIVVTVNAFDNGKTGPGMWWTLIQMVYNAVLTCFAVICTHTDHPASSRVRAVSEARASIELAQQSFAKLMPEQPDIERFSIFIQHILRLCDHIVQESVGKTLTSFIPETQSSQIDADYLGPESAPFDLSVFEELYNPLFASR